MSSVPTKEHLEAQYRWDKLIEKLNKLSRKTDLSQETQKLIEGLTYKWNKLHEAGIRRTQSVFAADQRTESARLNNIRKNFQEDLQKLKEQLINLPYSKDKFLNSFLKSLDKLLELLEKLAVFFRNELTVPEGVPIPSSYPCKPVNNQTVPEGADTHSKPEPHKYHFFHPYTSVSNRVEDFLEAFKFAKL